MSELKIYCQACGEAQPFTIEPMRRDDLNSVPWGDILCATCSMMDDIEEVRTANEAVELLRKIDESGHPLGRLNQEIEAFLQATPAKPAEKVESQQPKEGEAKLTVDEWISEGEKIRDRVIAQQPAKCPVCKGTKQVDGPDDTLMTCDFCNGTGQQPKEQG